MVSRFLSSLFGVPPRDAEQGPTPPPESDDDRVASSLIALQMTVRGAGRDLPNIVSSQLRQIDDILQPLVDYIAQNGCSTEQRVLLEAIIGDYLPTPLRAFLAASEQDRSDDARATNLLCEQLALLFATAQDLNHQVRSGAITELSTYARFLGDKFEPSMLTGGNL
ncbi:hypothetical protein GCM10023081_42930 [Arthrobacter ginkgonis]|uniref:Uncharacterized protein n=1 Tax=Arthrobacter ginkgonis TaxID=1630594 RepID=A0ABP7D7G8_9MICC